MKLPLLILFCASQLYGQLFYVATKNTTLSSAAEVVTVQHATSSQKAVQFVSAYFDSTVACTITLERNGTAATTTVLTPLPVNLRDQAATNSAFSASNVGTGTVLGTYNIAAGGAVIIDLIGITMPGAAANTGDNLTIRTSGGLTGTVNIIIKFKEI